MPLVTSILTVPDGRPQRLDDFLFAHLPVELAGLGGAKTVSRTKMRSLILTGSVQADGRKVDIPGRLVSSGQQILVRLDTDALFREKKPDDTSVDPGDLSIVFEDEFLLVMAKPPGLPVDATHVASRETLVSLTRRMLETRENGRHPDLFLQHRLDKDTSGLVLFSKAPDINKDLHEMFMKRQVGKTYQALASGAVAAGGEEFVVDNLLGRLSPSSRAARWGSVDRGGKPARTVFRVLRHFDGGSHIQATPLTGRTHQIRVHLSEAGMPILGDTLYGGPARLGAWPVPRVMLHAFSLDFVHPVTGRQVCLELQAPADFKECLRRLSQDGRP